MRFTCWPDRRLGALSLLCVLLIAGGGLIGCGSDDPPPPPPQRTTVHVDTAPEGAEIVFSNTATGEEHTLETPGNVALDPGTYAYVIRKDGYVTQRSSGPLEVERGLQQELGPFTLQAGEEPAASVRIETEPDGAEVILIEEESSEEYVVETPANIDLSPGSYTYTVQRDGYEPYSSEEAVVFASGEAHDLGPIELTPEQSAPAPPPPPEDVGPTRVAIEVQTVPDGADVTLTNVVSGEEYSVETPGSIDVTPGLYSYVIRKEEYLTRRSGRPVDLSSTEEQTLGPFRLSRTNVRELVAQADEAYEAEDCQSAVALYGQLPRPAATDDDFEYSRSKIREGNCHWQALENLGDAVDAYEEALAFNANLYAAHVNLALIRFDQREFDQVLTHVERVRRLRSRVPVAQRLEVMLRMQYLEGASQLEQAQSASSPTLQRSLGQRSLSSLQTFMTSARRESPEALSEEIADAENRASEARALLRTIN